MPARAWTQRTLFASMAAALLASLLDACGSGSTTSTLPPLSTEENAPSSVMSQPVVSSLVAPPPIAVPGVRRVEALTTSGFVPSAIANLAAWYDAADSSTVRLSANSVTAWSDKSGHGNDVGQVNPSAQPAYAVQSINGRNTLRFVGHAFMTSISRNFSTQLFNDSTVFLVTNQTTAPQVSTVVWSGLNQGDPRYSIRLSENGVSHFDFNDHGRGRLTAPDVPSGVALWTARGSVGQSQTFSKDGAVIASTSAAVASVSGNYPLVLGAMTGSGMYSDFFDGNLAEVVVYHGALLPTQTSEVEGYLACKWGLQSQLPASHPYRNVCPGSGGPTPGPSPAPTIPPSHLPSENPIWANDFVDSIGVNTHCTYASWGDCQPQNSSNPTAWIAALKTLGIRHLRDGFFGPNGAPFLKVAQYRALSSATGMKYDFVTNEYNSSSTAAFGQAMAALPGSIDAFEIGGNEPDSPWNGNYDECQAQYGMNWACWPQQVTSQVAKDSQPVRSAGAMAVGPSVEFGNSYNSCTHSPGTTINGHIVAIPSTDCGANGSSDLSTIGAVANQTSMLDACNMHPYTGANPGWSGLGSYMSAERSYCRSTPWITENGYSSSGSGDLRISKYEPRIFAEDWYEGIRRTYTFELSDTPAAGGFFAPFGLVAYNNSSTNPVYTPKLQYESLRSLIQLMNDQGSRPSLTSLRYQVTGSSSVHHILAQRQDGSYELMLWKEVQDAGSPQTETVDLKIANPYKYVTVAQFTPQNGQYTSSSFSSALQQGDLDYGPIVVSDAMSIYHFSTSPIGAPRPLSKVSAFTMSSLVP